MALYQAPSFEALEKLTHGRDVDLTRRQLVDPKRNRGRGAQTNASGRFERHQREDFDDGWNNVDPLPVFETIEHVERARESARRVTMLEFQHENVGKPRSTAADVAQKIASNPLTYKG